MMCTRGTAHVHTRPLARQAQPLILPKPARPTRSAPLSPYRRRKPARRTRSAPLSPPGPPAQPP
eukprot:292740-Prorocentrum_minimum.AAC.1